MLTTRAGGAGSAIMFAVAADFAINKDVATAAATNGPRRIDLYLKAAFDYAQASYHCLRMPARG